MASTSASSVQMRSFKYDVFLSFRGEDTRKTFVDHLYHAFTQKSITAYKDDERIKKGEMINDQLIRSIEESRFYIIVFSKNYASSSWCLNELVKIMECQKMSEHTAYPIFYDVEPTEVRNQSGAVGEAFAKHVKGRWRFLLLLDHLCSIVASYFNLSSSLGGFTTYMKNEDDVGRWRNAMKEAAALAGMELKNTFNGVCSAAVVCSLRLTVVNGVYGFVLWCSKGCWVLPSAFFFTCSRHEAKFIEKIIEDVSLKLYSISSSFDGKLVGMETRVKNVISSLEIDSNEVRMIGIKGMGGGGKTTLARAIFNHISIWFEGKSFVENVREVSKGSPSGLKELQKKILTDVLNDHNIVEKNIQELENMKRKMMRSLKVLIVLDDVDDIEQLEALVGELTWFKPGSRIIITTRDEQVLVAHRVRRNDIYDVTFLSHDEAFSLFSRYAFGGEIPNQGYRELSRKVVSYAAGLPLTIKVLGSYLCGRSEREWVDAIERLETIPLEKTLKRLELSYNGLENDQKDIFLDVVCMLKGEMKDKAMRVLESCGFKAEIGLRVLEQKSLITISDADGLRFHDHIEEMGRDIVRRLYPDEPSRHSRLWIKEEIEDILVNELGTKATRSVKLKNTDLHPPVIMKGLRNMKELRCLYVDNEYRKWEVDEVSQYLPEALRSLSWYRYPFRSLPKTFRANNLVNLEMVGSNITQLWEGVERKVLKKLRFVDLRFSKLRTFDLETTPNIEILDLEECSDLVELHMHVNYPRLKTLKLGGSELNSLNLRLTPNLETLSLKGCIDLVDFDMDVELPNLKFLDLSDSMLSNLNLGLIPNLERLDLGGCKDFVELHMPVECSKLKFLNLCKTEVRNFDLGLTPRLETLYLVKCHEFVELRMPSECSELKFLNLSCSMVRNLNGISRLKQLKSLQLASCVNLKRLPGDLDRLEALEALNVRDCSSFRDLPNSITNMKCLRELDIELTSISLPKGIYQLKGLRITPQSKS